MPTTLLLAHPDLKTQRQLCCKKSYVSFVNVSERGTDYARHTTTSPQSHIQNAIYPSFHPIQTEGDRLCPSHNCQSPVFKMQSTPYFTLFKPRGQIMPIIILPGPPELQQFLGKKPSYINADLLNVDKRDEVCFPSLSSILLAVCNLSWHVIVSLV